MTSDETKKAGAGQARTTAHASGKGRPDWSSGLRRLYDSVVDEPLPDNFKDLLSQLDKDSEGSKDGQG
ncbi:hypothetical protein MKP08_02480 [Erythrobacter sp. LQ02-29]|uniref:NepR family anti-sigma factor n=1 Tax=unclassified Erythrobacter TaxID=2633097 RepID=UPI001BFCB08E|nr:MULTISPECIES: NepR family anti-sigma factor [unclassified Erythrobacter]MCP9221613.1 hypothetical protein [Erythrobacter sp. LQ02-29]QWC57122.1 hypothetical protein F7D01_08510 [Erythrobacter sp. 3-20A1M]